MTTIEATHSDLASRLDALEAAVGEFQHAELDGLPPEEELALQRRLEVIRRRLDHGTDRSAGHLDTSAAFVLDGHRNAKSAIVAISRVPGAEAHRRVQTARALRQLPHVEAAYAAGEIPTSHVRAIVRTVSNPRVAEHVEGADPIFAEVAARLGYDELRSVLTQWETHADPDGTGECNEQTHERRHLSLNENAIDGSGHLEGSFGGLQTAVLREILERYEEAEFHVDWAEAREAYGADARVEHLPRTARQRRADALVEIFRRAGVVPEGRSPEPLVNIIMDQDSFEEELRRAAGEDFDIDPNAEPERRRCHTLGGTPLHPTDGVAAALVGHVRRVVVDAAGTVIDLGRKRRLFTGSSQHAVRVQTLLRSPGGLRCFWPGCDGPANQADHRTRATDGGPTDTANGDAYCGTHNRTKEHGYRPVQRDDQWVMLRPDGTPITPPV